MKALHQVAWILVIIGGLNWGLMVLGWDIATWGLPSGLVTTVYALVGLSAIYELFIHKKNCKICSM
jgi:uncharacterized membrane protein YuzA (DUF378 family)